MDYIRLALLGILILVVHSPTVSQTPVALDNLRFGDQLLPGITTVIAPSDAGASYFKITGRVGAEVQVTFILPRQMEDAAGNHLPITFGPDSGSYSTGLLNNGSMRFDPHLGFTAPLSLTGELHVWVGAAVHPATTQPGAIYSGEVAIDVSYTTR